MIALFNDNKDFIGYSSVLPPTINLFKDLGDIDLTSHCWEGNYDTGCVKIIREKKVDQFELENDFLYKLKCLYSNELIQFLCIKQIHKLAEKLNCHDENFRDMYLDMKNLIDLYENAINSLKEQNRLDTKEEIYERHKSVFQPPEEI